MDIPFSQSNVSAVSIARVNAENTTILNSGGSTSVFAGIVVCEKGTPYEVLKVNGNNLYSVLGAPLHPTAGICAEPMRHLEEAVTGGEGYVVRVTSDNAKFPFIRWIGPSSVQGTNKATESTASDTAVAVQSDAADTDSTAKKVKASGNLKSASSYQIGSGSMPFGSDPSTEFKENDVVMLYVIDGNPSTNRAVSFAADPANEKRLILKLTESNSLGVVTTLDTYTVSLFTDVTDDFGAPAWIETQLENKSKYLRAIARANPTGAFKDATARLAADSSPKDFIGGTAGDMNKISAESYEKALTVLRNTPVFFSAVLGLGCYDRSVLNALSEIARNRRVDAFFDIDPRLSYAEALTKSDEYGFNDHEHIAFYHFPYTYRDKTSRATTVAGLSGTAFRAKALGVQKVPSIGGWHYSPAGEERGVISRDNLQCASWAGEPHYDQMYTKRINKVASSRTGVMTIDDSLTAYRRENSLRLQHVNSTMNAIARDLYNLWSAIKHNPDDEIEENLTRDTPRVFDSYVASKALVSPSEDTGSGTEPYVISYKQTQDDMWEVTYSCCVTGTARRIAGIPILLRKA
ncbi:hypothetical protein [Enterobacter hormaechei]|uniref:hypothetical protein n=1 Tax=Enterobacter hormaechei TaxID=158836 RepID=UPI0007BE8971|nr:hypothetical protein [Enterobacter hormaechei]KZP84537.1 hypothetical protein A3N47_10080 [Enterobacter hormaechei subsp. xiangfangensis]RTM57474.1 hypothetical protein EKO17_23840 [Enterobacter hormaechei subsp. xiangfangensis]